MILLTPKTIKYLQQLPRFLGFLSFAVTAENITGSESYYSLKFNG